MTNNLKFFKDFKKEIKSKIKENIKVIYTDADGTLLNHKGCLIKDYNDKFYFKAVKQFEVLADKNIDLVLVSGRNKMQLKYNAQLINLKNYIAELGSEVIYNLGEKTYITYDKSKLKYDFASLGPDLDKLFNILKKEFPQKIDYKPDWNKYRTTNVLFLGNIDLDKANKILKENGYEDYVLINNGSTELHKTDLNIKKTYFYNLMPKGIDKSTGIKVDKKIRNFKKENCLALGDSLEDLKMAKEVYYFFLINNNFQQEKEVLDELKKYENVYITEEHMNRGWVEVISYLFG